MAPAVPQRVDIH